MDEPSDNSCCYITRPMRFLELKIPPPLLILFAALLMGVVAYFGVLPLAVPFLWRCVVFVIMLIVGGLFLMSSVKLFNRANTTWLPEDPTKTTALVTGGLYRFSRNPMYLVWTLILTGWGVLFGDDYRIENPVNSAVIGSSFRNGNDGKRIDETEDRAEALQIQRLI